MLYNVHVLKSMDNVGIIIGQGPEEQIPGRIAPGFWQNKLLNFWLVTQKVCLGVKSRKNEIYKNTLNQFLKQQLRKMLKLIATNN